MYLCICVFGGKMKKFEANINVTGAVTGGHRHVLGSLMKRRHLFHLILMQISWKRKELSVSM